jgi:glutaredoxin
MSSNQKKLLKIIQAHRAVIFAKSYCPHSRDAIECMVKMVCEKDDLKIPKSDQKNMETMANWLFEWADIPVYFIDLEYQQNPEALEKVQTMLGGLSEDHETTVPRIFIKKGPQGIGATALLADVSTNLL